MQSLDQLQESTVLDLTFAEALAQTADHRRHLLLGNGFSISADARFNYRTLYKLAIEQESKLALIFNRLGVHDGNFERALQLADEGDQQDIRDGLIKAVTAVHPRLSRRQFEACADFLAPFAGFDRAELRGTIFTTNYDLLLYRALIIGKDQLRCHDAFDSDGYFNWAQASRSQVFYWHGALHIFRREIPALGASSRIGAERCFKMMADLTEPLVPKIAAHLRQGHFPIFVTQGTPAEKQMQIRAVDYLRKVRRHFRKVCRYPGSVLFTVGHSLSVVDQHIADAIGSSGLHAVYIGWFLDSDRIRISELATDWAAGRRAVGLPPLAVYAFRSADCAIWPQAS